MLARMYILPMRLTHTLMSSLLQLLEVLLALLDCDNRTVSFQIAERFGLPGALLPFLGQAVNQMSVILATRGLVAYLTHKVTTAFDINRFRSIYHVCALFFSSSFPLLSKILHVSRPERMSTGKRPCPPIVHTLLRGNPRGRGLVFEISSFPPPG